MRPPLLAWIAAAALLAACGASTASPASTSGAAGSAGAPTASPSGVAGSTVKVATATVSGGSEQVLTDASDGMTLYYFVPDTATSSKCTGTCAGYWPPLLLPSGQPTASGLSGTLSAITDANGRQVQYNGHFLYRYSGDDSPGQANGNGLNLSGGTWYVATPTLSAIGGGASASPSASSGSYSGY